MKIRVALCAATFAFASISAQAAGPATGESFLDVFYVPSSKLTIDVPSFGTLSSDGGAGFGLRGRAAMSPEFFFQGEYQKDTYDGFNGAVVDTNATFFRAGLGFNAAGSPFYGIAEFIKQKVDIGGSNSDDNGYGLHAGLQGHPGRGTVYAQLGYQSVGDFGKGLEFMAGGSVKFSPSVGMFADYRQTQQKDDFDDKATIKDFRLGFRASFGG